MDVTGEWECRAPNSPVVDQYISVTPDAVLLEVEGRSHVTREVAHLGDRATWIMYGANEYSLDARTGDLTIYVRRLDATTYGNCTKVE